ncbi:hypothetical protein CEUSTIGMA_g1308.t1 [Chlamydomonas eustigma]|uniref:Glycosyl transferase family 1 domain-containing protein n=1 Tax=Chlamydomonas eustigma TaxID=1157962 RepID=A0A250WSP0_9CHLO|nr:hypothetical protein CEUSTIGMA_g1308.t1 [Chlamydomonas eustigma]|eukprot:GAX73858.1 hypothetical protein CEUSTIGMA_g1308.t1 [Chlamydomonas eustigma]
MQDSYLKLHHACCGCPGTLKDPDADSAGAATAASSQVADSLISNYSRLFDLGAIRAERHLRIAYLIPHHHVTGGLKVLCQHVALLRRRGHYVVAVYRPPGSTSVSARDLKGSASDNAQGHHDGESGVGFTTIDSIPSQNDLSTSTTITALPSWSGVTADEEVLLGVDQHLASAYPQVHTLDAVVCGMFQQVPELLLGLQNTSVAIIYYEQGHEYLFGDVSRFITGSSSAALDRVFHMVMGLPVVLAVVSEHARKVLDTQFGRGRALQVPNGINTQVFCPSVPVLESENCNVSDVMPMQALGSQTDQEGLDERALTQQPSEEHNLLDLPNKTDPCNSTTRSQHSGASSTPESSVRKHSPWTSAGLPTPDKVIGEGNKDLVELPPLAVLMVGDPGLKLKGFEDAIEVLQLAVEHFSEGSRGGTNGICAAWLRSSGHVVKKALLGSASASTLHHSYNSTNRRAPIVLPSTNRRAPIVLPLLVTWVCQRMPGPLLLSKIRAAGADSGLLQLALYVGAPQELLPKIYRCHQALLFTSHYEAWGLPVLEAMASCLPVVTTACGGVSDFATSGTDCLQSEPGDVEGLALQLISVLTDRALGEKLRLAALKSAQANSLERICNRLENLLYSSVAASKELLEIRQHPLVLKTVHSCCMAAIEATKNYDDAF